MLDAGDVGEESVTNGTSCGLSADPRKDRHNLRSEAGSQTQSPFPYSSAPHWQPGWVSFCPIFIFSSPGSVWIL